MRNARRKIFCFLCRLKEADWHGRVNSLHFIACLTFVMVESNAWEQRQAVLLVFVNSIQTTLSRPYLFKWKFWYTERFRQFWNTETFKKKKVFGNFSPFFVVSRRYWFVLAIFFGGLAEDLRKNNSFVPTRTPGCLKLVKLGKWSASSKIFKNFASRSRSRKFKKFECFRKLVKFGTNSEAGSSNIIFKPFQEIGRSVIIIFASIQFEEFENGHVPASIPANL